MTITGKRVLAMVLIISIVSFLLMVIPVSAGTGVLNIHMLSFDGGRNDCFIIQLPNSQRMVLDCSEYTPLKSKLDELGITQIKYLVGTHEHIDHIGGFNNLLNAGFPINNTEVDYVKGALNATSDHYDWMVNAAHNRNMIIDKHVQGDYLLNTTVDGKVLQIKVLSPKLAKVDGEGTDDYDDENDASLVLKFTYGTQSAIFMGDARNVTEQDLLNSCPNDLNAQLLKVGHHGIEKADGTRYACTDAFLDKVKPTKALITNGDGRAMSARTITNLQERNISYWTTETNRYVLFTTDGVNGWSTTDPPAWSGQ